MLRHLLFRMIFALGLAGGIILLYGGCSVETRYKVLSTFFDGVPVPEGHPELAGPKMVVGPWGELIPAEEFEATPGAQAAAREREKVYFFHAPYRNRQCFSCHDREGGYDASTAQSTECRNCHESYFHEQPDDWVHGPLLFEQCVKCHEPHKSEYRGLLTQAQPTICFDCHDAQLVQNDAFHSTVDTSRCGACHDPHATGNRLLLADSRTYQRRKRLTPTLPSPHADWDKDTCQRCHQAEQSNQVVADVDQVCLQCHEQIKAPVAGVTMHQAVTDGKCTTCHAVHQSTRPHLIHPTAEQICYACHDPKVVQTPEHPSVTRVDCLLCHTGHEVEQTHMLRPGIAWAVSEAQP